MAINPLVCSHCGAILAPDDVFCSRCGTKTGLVQKIGIGRQIYIYVICFLLPPFGLIWVFRYWKNPAARRIAMVALLLTVVSLVVAWWTLTSFFQGLQNQMNSYTNLGL